MLKKLRDWFRGKFPLPYYPDPVYSCQLYKDKDCVFVDGLFCDFPKCSMNENYLKKDVIIYSQNDFDEFCKNEGINDDNVEDFKDEAFISIIGTPEVLEYYLHEGNTKHWFKSNHSNVLNLEFDDVSEDREFTFDNGLNESITVHAKAMTEEQAKQCVDFFNKNNGRKFRIHCRAGMSRSVGVGRVIVDFYDLYNDCKGKEYIDRMHPNVGVTSALKKVIYNNRKFMS